MKEKFILYLKFFMQTGVMYVILKTPIFIVAGREFNGNEMLNGFFIFGLGMSLTLVTYHIHSLKELAKRYNLRNYNLKARQYAEIISSKEPSIIAQRLAHINNVDKIDLDLDSKNIQARTGFNGKSWGDKIYMEFNRTGDTYLYKVSSQPKAFWALLDYGQNLENILKIKSLLTSAA